MLSALKSLGVFALCFGLSCAIWNPARRDTGHLSPGLQASPLGPGPVEWTQEQFLHYQTGLAPFEIREVAEAIIAESERLNIDRDLIMAVIHTESGFHAFARSHMGALGLMQVMPETGQMMAKELDIEWRGPEMLFEPVTNVRLGTQYLAFLYEKYSNWDRALAAYNWGPERIDRRLHTGRALPARYVRRVTARLESARGR